MHDDPLVDAIHRDPLAAPVNPRMKAIARYAHKLTLAPRAMTKSDVEALRAAGLTEMEIADVNYICGYFNMMNRLAQGLGIEPSPGPLSLPVR